MQHPPALIKRRRRGLQGIEQGESSREASAESNDETTSGPEEDDTASLSAASIGPALTSRDSFETTSIPSFTTPGAKYAHPKRHPAPLVSPHLPRVMAEIEGEGEISEGSAGHDGDISSATAPSLRSPISGAHHPQSASTSSSILLDSPSTPALTTPALPGQNPTRLTIVPPSVQQSSADHDESTPPSPHHSPRAVAASRYPGHSEAPPAWESAPTGFLSNLTAEDIQDHIKTAIAGDPGRAYRIMVPPQGRPVRIYADGVYDLLHYGHMLQLRQCKLAFPSVHLMVGVCSDELVRKYKAPPVLTSAERYESVRHCKWVDEVVEDAPWQVDAEFFAKHKIDYVAHDEEPYVSAGSQDVYAYAKSIGAFLPTKRTNGVSTSELLQRIVEGYREGEFDGKFMKLGLSQLCSTRAPSEAGTHESKSKREAAASETTEVTKEDEHDSKAAGKV